MKHKPRFPITCAATTRKYFADTYPGLKKNAAYWRMLVYLLYPNYDDLGRWYLGHDLIDHIAQQKTNALDFLKNFQRDVLPNLAWDEPGRGKARTVICPGLSDMDYNVFVAGLGSKEVYWEDGKKWTKVKQAEDNYNAKNAMLEEAENAQYESQKTILTYHANISTRGYALLISKNKKYLDALALNDIDLRHAEAICKNPKPCYHIVAKTTRLYPNRGMPNLTSCKRTIRRALTMGCYELDLANAHLAIIAKDWNIPTLTNLLLALSREQKKVWVHLAELMAIPYTPAIKNAFKKAIYTLCYGGGLRLIYRDADKLSGIAGFGKKLMHLPIMLDILAARKIALAWTRYEMDDEGGILDTHTDIEARSLLSCESQRIEQDLIAEVYEAVNKINDAHCNILVYSFDGVTISITHPEKEEVMLKKIKQAVDNKIWELGIISTLEMELIQDV